MYNFLLIILFSFIFCNSSYLGLLLPSSTSCLSSFNQDYNLSKNILLRGKSENNISSHYISFPNSINIGVFNYDYFFKSFKIKSSISIINYGNFEDSESNYTFSSNDYIMKNRIFKALNKNIYSSIDLKYLYSNIDIYTSHALMTKLSFFFHRERFLLQLFIDNHGVILDSYTRYNEKLPSSFGYNFMVIPKYINAIISVNYNIYKNYNSFNLTSELSLIKNSSIMVGFSSLSKDLYYGEFYNDILTGISITFNSKYKSYLISMGFKNLGAIGIASSLSIKKYLN